MYAYWQSASAGGNNASAGGNSTKKAGSVCNQVVIFLSMKFRTEIERAPFAQRIDSRDGILLAGSCFSDHIGKWLEDCWLNAMSNPWGVLFNPASIAQSLARIQKIGENGAFEDGTVKDGAFKDGAFKEEREPTSGKPGVHSAKGPRANSIEGQRANSASETGDFKLYEQNGIFYSFDHHGKWSGKNANEVQRALASLDNDVARFYRKAKHVFITFGTSWVYEREGRIVANCHKFPASEFKRRPLSIAEIADMWSEVIEKDRSCAGVRNATRGDDDGNGFGSSNGSANSRNSIRGNDDCKNGRHWIFTVSPIRHIKDTLHGNQLSKSTLLLAIDELQRRYPSQVDYLNVYELFNDELRDYRFYDSDMVHPSQTGIEAVRELVSDCCFTQKLQQYMHEAEPIARALQHRPTDPDSPEYKDFLAKTLKQKEALVAKFMANAEI